MTRAFLTLAALVGIFWASAGAGAWIGYHLAPHPDPVYVTDPAVCRLALMEARISGRDKR